MDIKDAIALVTGASRGLGKAYVQALLDAGAQKIYVAARKLMEVTDPRLQPIKLDITDPQEVARAAEECQDVNILINNAGLMLSSPLLEAPSMENARKEMDTNYFGTLAMCRAFAPVLKRNGGGALVNMLSVVSWYTFPLNGSYSASKAAQWSLTNGIRVELRQQGTLVVGVYASYIDTDMASHVDYKKTAPEEVATRTIKAIAAGREEVLAGTESRAIRVALNTDPQAYYQRLQRIWDSGERW
ncbi:MAG TPA: SDR family oxidoreductase [Dictyobacter sp.]|jgi:NAD(P)-dependent dehydrogenase (short-subunit alcohol dehydrogenase family)|nr:SDR family oxidoreductase [Dictyobacter sp.]